VFAGTSAAGAAFEFSAGAAVFALASAGAAVFALASVETLASVLSGASAGVSGLAERTDTLPVSAGIDNSSAETMNKAAAAIVIFESIVAVPRGLKAELDTLLVNSAPASVLPGCSRTAATSTRHERKNNPYKK